MADEIMWPEGEEALPGDAQDLITKLLRQSPLDRLGTGAELRPGLEGCGCRGAFEGCLGARGRPE